MASMGVPERCPELPTASIESQILLTPLPVCTRFDRRYEHIMIVVNRLSKNKKFIPLDSLEVEVVVQAFIEWI